VGDSSLFYQVLHTHLFKDCVFMKTNLDNYNEIINPCETFQSLWHKIMMLCAKSFRQHSKDLHGCGTNEYRLFKVGDSSLFYQVLHTHLFKDCVFMKTNLDNYNEIINPCETFQSLWHKIMMLCAKSFRQHSKDLHGCGTKAYGLTPSLTLMINVLNLSHTSVQAYHI
jgi:predicted transposase YbfD/YdcC